MFNLSETNLRITGLAVRSVVGTFPPRRLSSFTALSSMSTRRRRRSVRTARPLSHVLAPFTVTPTRRISSSFPRTGFSVTAVISTCRSRTNWDNIKLTPTHHQKNENNKMMSSLMTFDQSYQLAFFEKSTSMKKDVTATGLFLQIFSKNVIWANDVKTIIKAFASFILVLV